MLMQLLKGQQRLQSADRTREKGRTRGEQFLPEGGANAGQRLMVKIPWNRCKQNVVCQNLVYTGK